MTCVKCCPTHEKETSTCNQLAQLVVKKSDFSVFFNVIEVLSNCLPCSNPFSKYSLSQMERWNESNGFRRRSIWWLQRRGCMVMEALNLYTIHIKLFLYTVFVFVLSQKIDFHNSFIHLDTNSHYRFCLLMSNLSIYTTNDYDRGSFCSCFWRLKRLFLVEALLLLL